MRRPSGLADALSSSDIAVVAGGVTLYEACALGVPSVGLAVVAPQRAAIRSFAALGAIIDAGGPHIDRRVANRVADSVTRLARDARLRRRLGERARRLIDGKGADRVALRIRSLAAPGQESRRG
jgi:spore coat polysaccharide biosynthesis predicted glycosyltransferase SpsG